MPVFKPIRKMIDLAENPPSDGTLSWLLSKPDPIRRPQLADVYGPLAMFKIKYGYNITHVPTGLRILNVIGTKALAIQVLDRLLEHETAWADGGPFAFGTLPDHWSGRTLHELTCRASEVMLGRASRAGKGTGNSYAQLLLLTPTDHSQYDPRHGRSRLGDSLLGGVGSPLR